MKGDNMMTNLQSVPQIENSKRLFPGSAVIPMITFAALALLSGCATAPESPGPMVHPDANFGEYKTFGLLVHHGDKDPEQPLSLVDNYIISAITNEMLSKGYSEAPDGVVPDILIDYEAARTDTVKNSPFSIGIGVGSYGRHGGASIGTSTSGVKKVSEGSLVIHAIDAARDAEVWRSQVSRELGKDAVDPEIVQSAVSEVLSDFPAAKGAP